MLNVSQCDSTQGTGDFFAELYGIDFSGYTKDYVLKQDNGNFLFQDVAAGVYEIAVFREGLKLFKEENVNINGNYQQDITLEQNLLPPRNVSVDEKALTASWNSPSLYLLNENFEDTLFPPQGWQNTGFARGDNSSFPSVGNRNSCFAAAPSQNAKPEYSSLITPAVDLREAQNFRLSFDYFFKAEFGEIFQVQYSDDGGMTWMNLQTITPYPEWHSADIDLGWMSGTNGKRAVMFRFVYAYSLCCHGYCALDDIKVYDNTVPSPEEWLVFLDSQYYAGLPGDSTSCNLTCIPYGEQHHVSVAAGYICGNSDTVFKDFTSRYLPSVRKPFFTYNHGEHNVNFNLVVKDNCNPQWHNEGLLKYEIYRDGDSIAEVVYDSTAGDTTYFTDYPDPNYHCYCTKAVYDLSYWGYPGQTGESATVCDSVFIAYGKPLPFVEEWNSGNFEYNNWQKDTGVIIDNNSGNPAPTAVFRYEGKKGMYAEDLTSDYMLTDFKTGAVWLDYDLKLLDTATYGNQYLSVQIPNGNGDWQNVNYITGTANFDWESYHIDVTGMMRGSVKKIRFHTEGDQNNSDRKWYIDNIKLYRTCQKPTELFAKYIWDGTFGIRLSWNYQWSSNQHENEGLIGFNIYRKSDTTTGYRFYDFVPFTAVGYVYYYDMSPDVNPQTGYFYKVDALYVADGDSLESDFAPSRDVPGEDFVYVFVTRNGKKDFENDISVYPVPAKNHITVVSKIPIEGVDIFNITGNKLYSSGNSGSKKLIIDLSGYPGGIYFLHIKQNGKSVYKKITVNR